MESKPTAQDVYECRSPRPTTNKGAADPDTDVSSNKSRHPLFKLRPQRRHVIPSGAKRMEVTIDPKQARSHGHTGRHVHGGASLPLQRVRPPGPGNVLPRPLDPASMGHPYLPVALGSGTPVTATRTDFKPPYCSA